MFFIAVGFLNKLAFFLIVSKKRKNAKKCCKVDIYGTFIILLRNFYIAVFLYKGVQICRLVFVGLFLSACFRVFIDSPAVPKFSVRFFYFCLFTGLFIKGEYETKKFFI